MTAPLLYTYRRCPYAMRARMALLVAGIAFDAFEVVLRDKPAAMLALSPKGTVPVLFLPNGDVLEQSWDIVRWALSEQEPHRWWSRAQTDVNLDLLARNDGVFKHYLDRYKYSERFGESNRDEDKEKAVVALLLPLENRLMQSTYLGGAEPCATDIAIFPFVRQFAAVESEWFARQPFPAVQAWLSGCLASPLFEACMLKLPSQTVTPFPTLAHQVAIWHQRPSALICKASGI
jgi:glutathione S-transferase